MTDTSCEGCGERGHTLYEMPDGSRLCMLCADDAKYDWDDLGDFDDEGLGPVPDCYGQGETYYGSEWCCFCPFEDSCAWPI